MSWKYMESKGDYISVDQGPFSTSDGVSSGLGVKKCTRIHTFQCGDAELVAY